MLAALEGEPSHVTFRCIGILTLYRRHTFSDVECPSHIKYSGKRIPYIKSPEHIGVNLFMAFLFWG